MPTIKTYDSEPYESSSIVYPSDVESLPAYKRWYQPGVGGPDDLRVRLEELELGRYAPAVTEGWYHLARRTRYLFSSRALKTITAAGTGIVTSDLGFNILEYSDVICAYEYGSTAPYLIGDEWTRVSCPLRAYVGIPSGSWTSAGNGLWYYEIPDAGFVLEVYRGSWGVQLSRVPGSGDISTSDQYAYDAGTTRLYCLSAAPPTGIFITYSVGGSDINLLTQVELLVVDRDGVVRTQYSDIYTGTDVYRPHIVRLINGSTQTVYPSGISKNEWYFNAGEGPEVGERVAAVYYVRRSFSVRNSGLKVDWFVESAPKALRLEFSASDASELKVSDFNVSLPELLTLEPLNDGAYRGFIYLRPGDDTPLDEEKAGEIDVILDRAQSYLMTYNNVSAAEPVAVLVRARTKAGYPARRIPVSVKVSGGTYIPACGSSQVNPPGWANPMYNYRIGFSLASSGTIPSGTVVTAVLSGDVYQHFFNHTHGLYPGIDACLYRRVSENDIQIPCHIRACSKNSNCVEVTFKLPVAVGPTTPLSGLWLYYGGPERSNSLSDSGIYAFSDDFLYYMPGVNTHTSVYERYNNSNTSIAGDPIPALLVENSASGVRRSISGISNPRRMRSFVRCQVVRYPSSGFVVLTGFQTSAGVWTDALGISSGGVLHYFKSESSSWESLSVVLLPGIEYGLELVVDRPDSGEKRNIIYVDGREYIRTRTNSDVPAYWCTCSASGEGGGSYKIRELAIWDYTTYTYQVSGVSSPESCWGYVTNNLGEVRFLLVPQSVGTAAASVVVPSSYSADAESIVKEVRFSCAAFGSGAVSSSDKKLILSLNGRMLAGQIVRVDGIPAFDLVSTGTLVNIYSMLGSLANGLREVSVKLGADASFVLECSPVPGDEIYGVVRLGDKVIYSQRLRVDAGS